MTLALVEERVGGADGRQVAAAAGGAVRVAELGPLAVGVRRAHHALAARPHTELAHRPANTHDIYQLKIIHIIYLGGREWPLPDL